MKAIFYMKALQEQGLTPTDRIVFCQVVYLSLMESGSVAFNADGEFCPEKEMHDGFIPISWRVSKKFLADTLRISLKQVYLSYERLISKGLIIEQYNVSYVHGIDLAPFFELQTHSGLSGWELIVYSYLANKGKQFEWVDKHYNAMANELNIKNDNLKRILQELNHKGFIEKMRKGHQVLLRTKF